MIHVEAVEADASWDDRVLSVPEGTIYQTTWAAKVARMQRHVTPRFIVARMGSDVVGQMLFFQGGVLHGHLSRFSNWDPLFGLSSQVAGRVEFAYAPLVFRPGHFDEVAAALLQFMRRSVSFSAGPLLPPMHNPALDPERIRAVFERSGFSSEPHGTFLVDLSPTEDRLWAALDKNSRYGVRRTERQGVVIEKVESESQKRECHAMMVESFARNGLALPFSFEDFSESISVYGPHVSTWMTRHDGRPVSALSLMSFNGIGFQFNLCHSDYGIRNKLYGNDLLEWHAIRVLKGQGERCYDLAGVTLNPQTPKEQNLYHFKSRWGGALYSTYRFRYVKPGIRSNVLGGLRKLRY